MTTQSGTARPRLALAVLSFVLFVTFLDNTIVSAALADIQTSLGAGVVALQWIVSSYALTFAALMLSFGTLSDRIGRRAVMMAGLSVFTAGSVIAAVATSSGMLIAGRVVMGVGAAASEPGTLSMIRQLYPHEGERAQALGVWAAVSGLALAAGPIIGGTLDGVWTWRAVFVFNVAAGVAGLVGVRSVLPETSDADRRRLDLPGFLLGATTLVAATFATIGGETAGYTSPWVVLLYVGAALAAVAFFVAERRAEQPVLDVRYFRHGAFTGGNLIAFTAYFAIFAVFLFIPLYLQLVGTSSPYDVALDFLPMAALMIAAAILSGRWVAARGPRGPMTVGCALAGVGVVVTDTVISPGAGLLPLGWSLALVGAGLGLAIVPMTSAVLAAVPARRSGMAASAVNTSRELGAVAGVAVLGSIVNAQLTTQLLHRLAAIPGLPAAYRAEVITAVTTGSAGRQASALPATGEIRRIVQEVLAAADSSFAHGLDLVLLVAGALLLASGVIAAALLRPTGGRPTLP